MLSSKDTAAFGELVRRHQSQVRNLLRTLSRDNALADDLAQDCFLHAWNKLSTYSGRGSFIGWLLKVAYTTFLQSKRKSKRYSQILESAAQVADMESRGAGYHDDEASDLDKYLAVLGEQERVVMLMSYAFGLSHTQIGEAIGIPIGTVKSVLFRAKETIRSRFEITGDQHGQHG